MEEKQYPPFLETKEAFEYVVNNFTRDYWEDDLTALYSEAIYCEPIGIQVMDKDGNPHNLVLHTKNNGEFKDWHKKYDELDYNFITRTDNGTEIREYTYKNKTTRFEVKLVAKPGSKAAKLGIDLVWLEDVLFLSQNDQLNQLNEAIKSIEAENAELEATIESLGEEEVEKNE